MTPSFKTRLALWHAVIAATVLALAALGANWWLTRAVRGQLDAAILALAETEAAMISQNPARPVTIHESTPGPAPPSFVRLDRLVQITDREGRPLAWSSNLGSARLPSSPQLGERLAAGETVFETLEQFGEEPVRMVSVPVQVEGSTRYVVQVAGSLDDVDSVLRAARLLFIAMSLALSSALGATGLLLTRRAFQPIDAIIRRAHGIGAQSLSERLPSPPTQDEIGRLTLTLNEMLNRIEQAVEAQKRFTADASHELRSPLSRLRAELEVVLRRPRGVAEYVHALRSCLDEVQQLSRLTEELLVLARLDAASPARDARAAALVPLVHEVIRRLEPEARRRHVSMTLEPSPDVVVSMAPDTANLVVTNLIDNAVKFSPPGGSVTVSIAAAPHAAAISIRDTGPGIPPDEIPYLFERFHRGSAARREDTPGVGLGLAISRAIVEGHGGKIDVASVMGAGTSFVVRLPLAPSASGQPR